MATLKSRYMALAQSAGSKSETLKGARDYIVNQSVRLSKRTGYTRWAGHFISGRKMLASACAHSYARGGRELFAYLDKQRATQWAQPAHYAKAQGGEVLAQYVRGLQDDANAAAGADTRGKCWQAQDRATALAAICGHNLTLPPSILIAHAAMITPTLKDKKGLGALKLRVALGDDFASNVSTDTAGQYSAACTFKIVDHVVTITVKRGAMLKNINGVVTATDLPDFSTSRTQAQQVQWLAQGVGYSLKWVDGYLYKGVHFTAKGAASITRNCNKINNQRNVNASNMKLSRINRKMAGVDTGRVWVTVAALQEIGACLPGITNAMPAALAKLNAEGPVGGILASELLAMGGLHAQYAQRVIASALRH